MNIDSLPNEKLVDAKGNVTNAWRNHFDQLVRQIQTFLSNERYLLPHQPDPRAASPEIGALDDKKNLGGSYYHGISNNMKVNLKTYSATDVPTYEFKPQLSYHSVETTADINSIPPAESEGKILTTTTGPDANNTAYIWVNNAWRKIALAT